MPHSRESRRAAGLKAAKTRANRRAATADSVPDGRSSPPAPLPPRPKRTLRSQRRANIVDDDDDDDDDCILRRLSPVVGIRRLF